MKRTSIVPLFLGLALLAGTLTGCASTGSDVSGPKAPAVDVSGFRSLGPMLATTAQPTATEIAQAKAAGYHTIVNFRPAGEPGSLEGEKDVAQALGMRYVNIPVTGHNFDTAQADALDAVLSDPASGACLMHCRSGTRAKAVWTIWLVRHDGKTADQALAEADRVGLSGEARAAVEKVIR